MPLPRRVARFNRQVTNRVTQAFAGRLPGFAILTHIGRRSGRVYRTPVNAFRDGNDYIIALTFGADSDWVRNVQAAGACELLTQGRRVSLIHPRIVTDRSRRWAPLPVRLILRLVGATEYMRLTSAPTPTAPRAKDIPDAPAGQEKSLRE